MIEHGGALDRAIAEFGGNREIWLDLSTGINPIAYPVPVFATDIWARLPDSGLEKRAIDAARNHYGFGAEAGVVAAPGTQALIQLYPHLAPPGDAVVIGPTYEEHAQSLGISGRDVRYERLLSSIQDEDMIVVVVNPNNPDGKIIPADALIFAAERLAERGGLLVVDEAFADMNGDDSVAKYAGMDGLIILKSFGKFFGLAGARLGFAAGPKDITDIISSMLGPWAVSGPALMLAEKAYGDAPAIAQIKADLKARRARLEAIFAKVEMQVLGGTDLFVLARHFQATWIHKALCEKHILVRKFTYQADWLRFGMPGDDVGFERLETALSEIIASI
jgi:cobalamin biosynthesis protein CobC